MNFGAVLTSSELRGVAPTADWRRWIDRGRAPASHEGAGFSDSWSDDLAQLAALGCSEVAITIEWARLWPTAERVVPEEVEFHRTLLGAARDAGMTAWACLIDGTVPGWFADDERGMVDQRSRSLLWPRHVDWVGETFGDLVDGWIPIREPVQWAMWSSLLGVAPPGRRRRRDALAAVRAGLEAELHAWRLLRGSAPIATFQTARTVHAEVDDVRAAPHAAWLDDAINGVWLTSLAEGPAQNAFDRVVVQLRPAVAVDGEGNWSVHAPDRLVETELEALSRVLDHTGDRAVTAAGDLGDVADDGQARADHLRAVVAGAAGVGASGWWQASPIDGWHWQGGFDREPGVIDADRNERAAAAVLTELID